MQNDQFENRIDDWAEVELGNSTKPHPRKEMVEMVQSEGKKKHSRKLYFDWTHAVVALSAIIVLLITYTSLIQPDLIFEPIPEQLPPVYTQVVTISGATYSTLAARPPEKSEGTVEEPYKQLDFQIFRSDKNKVESLDLRYELLQPLRLSSMDSYRLLLKPNYDQFIHLFIVDPAGDIQAIQGRLNKQRLPGSRRDFLPNKPNWFFIQGAPGEYKLYLVSSTTRLKDLDDLHDQYLRALSTDEKKQAAQTLSSYIQSLETETTKRDRVLWQLTFQFEGIK